MIICRQTRKSDEGVFGDSTRRHRCTDARTTAPGDEPDQTFLGVVALARILSSAAWLSGDNFR
jgi:hypothetical protein